MAYGDNVDPKSRVISIVAVGLITTLLFVGLASGLAVQVVKDAIEKMEVINVDEPPPPEVPPPPPPPDNKLPPPPPVVVPPSPMPSLSPNTINRPVDRPPPPQPPTPIITPPAPPAPPAVIAPRVTPQPARPRGNEQSWVTTDDYPSSAQREGAEGSTGTRLTIGADGRVTSCEVTSSSGNSALDQAACRNLQRRARFTPATDGEGQPTTGSYNKRVRWQLPEE